MLSSGDEGIYAIQKLKTAPTVSLGVAERCTIDMPELQTRDKMSTM